MVGRLAYCCRNEAVVGVGHQFNVKISCRSVPLPVFADVGLKTGRLDELVASRAASKPQPHGMFRFALPHEQLAAQFRDASYSKQFETVSRSHRTSLPSRAAQR